MRDEQTSPHRPRLVVSYSTCPPLSPSPHANSFVRGTAVINTHTILRESKMGTDESLKTVQRTVTRTKATDTYDILSHRPQLAPWDDTLPHTRPKDPPSLHHIVKDTDKNIIWTVTSNRSRYEDCLLGSIASRRTQEKNKKTDKNKRRKNTAVGARRPSK